MFERMLLSGTAGGKGKSETRSLFNRPLLASDGGVDWYGEVSSAEFVDGVGLASLIGLTSGAAQHSDAGWLHVGLDGTELLIAKRPLRHSLSWDHINAVNAVYGNRTVEINGQQYKVRLPKGANTDPTVDAYGWDIPSSHGSEWNRIFYRLTNDTYLDDRNTKASEEPFTHLAQYSEADLILDYRTGNGSYNWCQETAGSSNRVLRGYYGVSRLSRNAPSYVHSTRGWRPFLERVI